MKKILKTILVIITFAAVLISCAEESLDPLNVSAVKKGSILALRGTQLENIYFKGLPGYEVFPKALDGTERFDFDAEYLAEDPSTLESFDIFVIKRTKSGNTITTERLPLKSVSASEFKTTDDYSRPWVSVSIPFSDILDIIGLDPNAPDFVTTIFENYPSGISIEADLNLTDGSKVLASELVAAGLFQSNQFYPAQRLNIAVTNYCPEDIGATYSFSTTVTAVGAGGNIAGCIGTITGEGEFAPISRGRYSITDATFGQYDCAWDDSPAEGVTLINTCDLLTQGGADQYGLVYTFSNVSVSSDGTQMSFKWSNDYGDAGNTTLTRTDGGTWPTTLYSN
jgi:hypothetical protein